MLLASLVLLPPAAQADAAASPVFFSQKLAEMEHLIQQAVADHKCPGGVVWLERSGTSHVAAIGWRAQVPAEEPMTADTIFDAASLTKVLATTPAIMLLVEQGKLALDEPVARYLPDFAAEGKGGITLRQLLTHTSGLRPGLSPVPPWEGRDRALQLACAEKPTQSPGAKFVYSDINFILLGELVRVASGQPLDQFAARRLYTPLKLTDTGFLPPASKRGRIAPTTVTEGNPLRGVVHDPTARRMGGVAGHAGLFITASDLARFCRMMLNGGELDGVRVLSPESVRLMTTVQTPTGVEARRAIGWDLDSPYAGQRGDVFPLGGFGHTGWTGTSVWIDPFSRTFLIFLSNRNHPTEAGNVLPLRHQLANLAAEAVVGFNFAYVPGSLSPRPPAAEVPVNTVTGEALNGIDVLVRDGFAPLKGRRVGLITNHTGRDRQRRSTIDLLRAAPNVELRALFSPEHGIRGALDEKVADGKDEQTGLPVYSLYGETRQPTVGQLQGLDTLVFDIQDIGCRFYTYISTMGLAMEAAAKAGIRFVVLDRVNPLGGIKVDGPVHTGASSFTAFHSLPVQHGMTVGELARMFNAERSNRCELVVIPVEGWKRSYWFDQTSLPWTNPSPNMRSLTEATLYPGIGLLETTALSVGRGTGTPFEVVGAPYVDDVALAGELNRADLPGLRFVPVRFTPNASVYKDQICGGVQILLTDREKANPIDAGLLLARTLHQLYPKDFELDRFNRLLEDAATVTALKADRPDSEIRRAWAESLKQFTERRKRHLLYR